MARDSLYRSSELAMRALPHDVESARRAGDIFTPLARGVDLGLSIQERSVNIDNARMAAAVEEQRLADLQVKHQFLSQHLALEQQKATVDLGVAESQLRQSQIREELSRKQVGAADLEIMSGAAGIEPWQDDEGRWWAVRALPGSSIRTVELSEDNPRVQEILARTDEKRAQADWYRRRGTTGAGITDRYLRGRADEIAATNNAIKNAMSEATSLLQGRQPEELNPNERASYDAIASRLEVLQDRLRAMTEPRDGGMAASDGGMAASDDGTLDPEMEPVSEGLPEPTAIWRETSDAKAVINGLLAEGAMETGIEPNEFRVAIGRAVAKYRADGQDRDPVTKQPVSDETMIVWIMQTLRATEDPEDRQALLEMLRTGK